MFSNPISFLVAGLRSGNRIKTFFISQGILAYFYQAINRLRTVWHQGRYQVIDYIEFDEFIEQFRNGENMSGGEGSDSTVPVPRELRLDPSPMSAAKRCEICHTDY